jgi:hypothetical protein
MEPSSAPAMSCIALPGETLTPLAKPGTRVAVEDLLP